MPDNSPSPTELQNRIQEIEYAAEAAVAAVVGKCYVGTIICLKNAHILYEECSHGFVGAWCITDEAKTISSVGSRKKKSRRVSTLASTASDSTKQKRSSRGKKQGPSAN